MSPDEHPNKVDDIAYYLHLRTRLEHEDRLIVERLAWLMASESFLFTGYAIVLNGTGTPAQRRLTDLMPLVERVPDPPRGPVLHPQRAGRADPRGVVARGLPGDQPGEARRADAQGPEPNDDLVPSRLRDEERLRP